MEWQDQVREMDEQADTIITGWTLSATTANPFPSPFDVISVSAVLAKLGAAIGNAYRVSLSWDTLNDISKVIARGVGSVAVASLAGTSLLKWFPGVNVWVALLLQPTIVAAIAYSAGKTFKNYYQVHLTEVHDLTPEQIQEIAMSHFKSKIIE